MCQRLVKPGDYYRMVYIRKLDLVSFVCKICTIKIIKNKRLGELGASGSIN